MRRSWVVILSVVAVAGCSWTQVRGNAARTGANLAVGVTASSLADLRPAWTSADHGALAEEVVVRDGRALVPGANALWALDLATGTDVWHADRTLGHQSNELAAVSTWRSGSQNVVAMSQYWTDSVGGTPYFQNIGRVDQLDLRTGAVLTTEARAGATAPVATDDWAYFPQLHIVALPAAVGGSQIELKLVARALDGSGATFLAALPGGIPNSAPEDVAVDHGTLYARSPSGLSAFPADGCGQPSCAPTWTSTYGASLNSFGQIAVADDRVVDLDRNGNLTVLPARCAAATCAPLWTTAVPGATHTVAVASGRIYVTAGSTLSVFRLAGCGAVTCAPAWTSVASGPLSTPSVANDVVLAGTTSGDLVAWRTAGCGAPTCPVTWSQAQGAAVGPVTPVDHALLFPVGGVVRKLAVPV